MSYSRELRSREYLGMSRIVAMSLSPSTQSLLFSFLYFAIIFTTLPVVMSSNICFLLSRFGDSFSGTWFTRRKRQKYNQSIIKAPGNGGKVLWHQGTNLNSESALKAKEPPGFEVQLNLLFRVCRGFYFKVTSNRCAHRHSQLERLTMSEQSFTVAFRLE